ncbi:MAG: toll/interleukin-1 receptor domain-containing protein [Pseudomonadota bacterium]|nr:toll/interleukin-1 receptor domain-containing protein [Pseudomonadota bacterium]
MSDIFVSYSSKDRDRAALVARALEARGWSVWWDRTIPPGRQYDDVIEEALAEARCVVVLWSKASAASTRVKNEASEAVSKKALIPALIEDEVKIPFEFRRVQAADLSRWQGDATAAEFMQFCDAIAAEVEAATTAEPSVRAASPASIPAAYPASAASFASQSMRRRSWRRPRQRQRHRTRSSTSSAASSCFFCWASRRW